MRKAVWRTGASPCDFCVQLDGKVVDIQAEESFVPKGESLQVEGKSPIWAGADVMHPPIHRSCTCSISLE